MLKRVTLIPCIRLPRHLGFFDYTYDETATGVLHTGMFVEAPFRNKTIVGVVVETHDDIGTAKLKPLAATRPDLSLLPAQDIEYILAVAKTYCVSPATIFKIMYPAPSLKAYKKKKALLLNIQKQRRQLSLRTALKPTLFHYNQEQECIEYYTVAIRHAITKKEQLIIITPTEQRTQYLQTLLSSKKEIVYSSSEDGVKHQRAIREHAANNTAFVFIGTRQLLGIPYFALTSIIVDQSEHRGHKLHEGSPLLDTCTTSAIKAHAYQSRLTYCSCAPRMEEYSSLTCTHPKKPTAFDPILIDLHDEFRGGNTSHISERLRGEITKTLALEQSVILYLNHKGTSKYVACKDCKYVFACPQCDSYLRFTQKGQQLSCATCTHTQSLSDQCPSCHSVNFIFPGLGIEKIANQLSEEFSETPIITIDAQTSSQLPNSDTPSIIIGTSYLLNHTQEYITQAGLLACIAADPVTSMEQFRSLEHQWQEYAHFFSFRSSTAICIIQAFNAQHPFVQSLSDLDYHRFAGDETTLRKTHQLPPFSHQITCIYKGLYETQQHDIQTLVTALRTVDISPHSLIVTVIPQSHTRVYPQVLITLPGAYDVLWVIPEALRTILMTLSVDFLIDPDPRIL